MDPRPHNCPHCGQANNTIGAIAEFDLPDGGLPFENVSICCKCLGLFGFDEERTFPLASADELPPGMRSEVEDAQRQLRLTRGLSLLAN